MLTKEQRESYAKAMLNPETLAVAYWSREDLRTLLRDYDIEPTEENVDRLLKAEEFPADDIEADMVETGWDALQSFYSIPLERLAQSIAFGKDSGKTVRELAERLGRNADEWDEDAQERLDRWMQYNDEGNRQSREEKVFDAMMEAHGLGDIPTTQWETLYAHAARLMSQCETLTTRVNKATMAPATTYSPTAVFHEVITTAAGLLAEPDENGDPHGIHGTDTDVK